MNLSQAKKILIIRLSSLGDVLLTTPVVRSIKKKHPDLLINFLIKENFQDAVKLNPNLDKIIIYEDSEVFLDQLKLNDYDMIIDLQNNLRSKKIVKKLELPTYKFVKPNLEKFLLVHFKINLLKDAKPIPVRYADTIPELKLDDYGPELFIPESSQSDLDNQHNNIGFCPGAVHFTKRWPLEYFAELGNKLSNEKYQIVILGGESDRSICSDLQKLIPNSIDLSNNNDLFQTAAHMKNCKLIICNDSGLMHTATSLNIPVISIFGSTVKEFGFAPYKSENLIIEDSTLSCRPCSHIGRKKCPKKHFNCMTKTTAEIVYSQFCEFLERL